MDRSYIHPPTQVIREYWTEGVSLLEMGHFKTIQYERLPHTTPDLDVAVAAFVRDLGQDIASLCEEQQAIKVWLLLYVRYESANPEEQDPPKNFVAKLLVKSTDFYFCPPDIYNYNIIQSPYKAGIELLGTRLLERNAKFIRDQSGLVLTDIIKLNLNCAPYRPLVGSQYVPLPNFLQRKKAIVNITNSDNRCFGYSMLAFFLPNLTHKNRASNYTEEMFMQFKLDTVEYPVSPLKMNEMEQHLQTNINLFSFFDDEGRARYPMYVSRSDFPRSVDLLYWNGHYAWIKNFGALFADLTKHNGRLFWCRRCLGHFRSENEQIRHAQLCTRSDFTSILHVLPSPDTIVKFRYV